MTIPKPQDARRLRIFMQATFWFFLLKGLAWLVVPAALVYWGFTP